MTYEELIVRLNNLFWMLEEEGHYTKANTASFAAEGIKQLVVANEAQAAEIERLRGVMAKVTAAYRLEAMRRDDYSHATFDEHITYLTGDNT